MRRELAIGIGVLLTIGAFVAPIGTDASERHRVIVVLRTDRAHDRVRQLSSVSSSVTLVGDLPATDSVVVEVDPGVIQTLEQNPDVLRIEPDAVVSIQKRAPAPQITPWGIDRIAAPASQSVSTGSSVKVAVIDTGIDLAHPDLLPNLRPGINIVRSTRTPDDDNGHGTHVAGIIGAANNTIGVVGVAPAVELYPVKVLNSRGVGYLSDIIAGIDWAIANRMDIINLSLGTSDDIQSMHDAVRRADAAGITVVAASGNSGGAVMYPAAYDEVIAVGMTDDSNAVSRYSSRGPQLDLVAPGDDILSTYKGQRYREMTGTSMASPHVVGVAALLEAVPSRCDRNGDSHCNHSELQARLQATATDIGAAGYDTTSGYGIVNALRAVSP